LSADRCFDPDPSQRACARELYSLVRGEPIVSPHGHVDPALLSRPEARFGTPAELLIIPDHYVCRMLYSRGVPLEDLGVPTTDGTPIEADHRRIWQRFAEHFYLFSGTPSGLWLSDVLVHLFGVAEKLNAANAQDVYTRIETLLSQISYSPRALFVRFKIATLCTTDAATSTLEDHRSLQLEGWGTAVRPTFRPDAVTNLDTVAWRRHIERLSELSRVDVVDYASFIRALEQRRGDFRSLGAVATDHAALTAHTAGLGQRDANIIFQRALHGESLPSDAAQFTAHMLVELARMSVEDGMVMQLHVGSFRDHNAAVFSRFGADKGADIPVQTDWTRGLRPLLNAYGNDARFRLILFTLDESAYGRELAPLAGHYPAVLLGPPWWFFDSVNGMRRYLDEVVETAGLYNLAGFNDDTRAFCSIPARHDVWRRVTCNWLAGLAVQGLIDLDDAHRMAIDCASGLAKSAYRIA
jgi:glucuronate isomerase